jgi:hypothetical protein
LLRYLQLFHPCGCLLVSIVGGTLNFLLAFSRFVSVFVQCVLSSENFILNFSIFAEEIGFRIFNFVSVRNVGVLDIRVLKGIFSVTGWWSELSCWFMFVLAWYCVGVLCGFVMVYLWVVL